MSKVVTALIAGLGAASVAMAPVAIAEPTAGSQSVDSTISDLKDEGYEVQINWVNGARSGSLSDCTVTDIHNPNRTGKPPTTFTTVYIDVACPDHHTGDDFGIFFGGLGFF